MIGRDDTCIICGTTQNLHKHHIFYGTGYRQLSEKYGMTCMLCARHHNMSTESVHLNPNNGYDLKLKQFAQKEFEKKHNHEKFMKTFGRNYL